MLSGLVGYERLTRFQVVLSRFAPRRAGVSVRAPYLAPLVAVCIRLALHLRGFQMIVPARPL